MESLEVFERMHTAEDFLLLFSVFYQLKYNSRFSLAQEGWPFLFPVNQNNMSHLLFDCIQGIPHLMLILFYSLYNINFKHRSKHANSIFFHLLEGCILLLNG